MQRAQRLNATALELARPGATIVILGRSGDNGRQALADIARGTGNDKGNFLMADLSLQFSVRSACAAFKQRYDRSDVLANLAGAIYWEKQITEEGIERMLASFSRRTGSAACGHSTWYLRMLSPMMNALAARDCKAGVYAASAAEIDGLNGIFIDDKLKLLPI